MILNGVQIWRIPQYMMDLPKELKNKPLIETKKALVSLKTVKNVKDTSRILVGYIVKTIYKITNQINCTVNYDLYKKLEFELIHNMKKNNLCDENRLWDVDLTTKLLSSYFYHVQFIATLEQLLINYREQFPEIEMMLNEYVLSPEKTRLHIDPNNFIVIDLGSDTYDGYEFPIELEC